MASPIELTQVTSLPDVLLQDHFSLLIPAMPGGGDARTFEIRNMTATLPGRSNNVVAVELHKHKVHYAGKRIYPHTFSSQFVDTSDRKILDGLLDWQNMMTTQDTGLPRPKEDYATTGVITIFGADNRPVDTRTFYGLFPSNVQDIALAGATNSPIQVQVSFNYDYWMPGAL